MIVNRLYLLQQFWNRFYKTYQSFNMKHASLLFALCVLFSASAFAQAATTVEKTTKRITITTKKVDENGKTITETYIAEGEEPSKILEGMAINPETIKQVDITNPAPENEERLFIYRNAGDKVNSKLACFILKDW